MRALPARSQAGSPCYEPSDALQRVDRGGRGRGKRQRLTLDSALQVDAVEDERVPPVLFEGNVQSVSPVVRGEALREGGERGRTEIGAQTSPP